MTTDARAAAIPAVCVGLALLCVLGTAAAVVDTAGPVARTQGNATNETVQTYNGSVAVEDLQVRVTGTAPGAVELIAILVGPSGATVTRRLGTGPDGSFDANVLLESDGRRLTPGTVQTLLLSPGRDGVFGRSGEAPDTSRDLLGFVEDLQSQRLTQAQIVFRLQEATFGAVGSDDRAIVSEFQLVSARTRITAITRAGAGPGTSLRPGDTVVVRGVTNRRPDQNAIDVAVGSQGGVIVDDWGTDGVWTATIPLPENLTPGSYVVRASDGDSTDSVTVTVGTESLRPTTRSPRATPSPTATARPTAAPTDAPTTAGTTTVRASATRDSTPARTTGDGLDGFGPVVVALVLAGLAVLRRSGQA